jgi:hypothetical protein
MGGNAAPSARNGCQVGRHGALAISVALFGDLPDRASLRDARRKTLEDRYSRRNVATPLVEPAPAVRDSLEIESMQTDDHTDQDVL